ncbi:MAG: N-acyl homoserine lactonase family protein [Burkholderiales bacterium]|nr:N-acyl homoserine lactonase family protein [Burkholderiales bacterium]
MKLPTPDRAQDGVYHVYALCFARVPERRVYDNFIRRDMHDGPMPLDFFVWIVRNAQRTILVDTGFGKRAVAQRGRPLDVDPVDALARLGIDPDALEDIVLTHLHFDHAGNIERFAKARFHLQDAEAGYATGRCMCEAALRYPYDVEDVVTFVRHTYAERIHFHDGDAAPWPGVSLHAVPGHTLGMQAVRVVTPRGPIVLASDASHFYANVLRRAPFVVTVDARATLRSYDRLLELAGSIENLVPGHDPLVRAVYPSAQFDGIELTLLHEAPDAAAIAERSRLR